MYNESSSEVEGKFLQASQQLQADKQTYGSEHIHLYVEDIEGDWLENWDWEDNLADYVDAFYAHCQQKNYLAAYDTLSACDEQLLQPQNYQKRLELYSHLAQIMKAQTSPLSIDEAQILTRTEFRIWEAESLIQQLTINNSHTL
ncbi:hypothetical protein [Amazonocrinis nigriterrae]|nr:hypothetical protein [Amazonocrinis nigriterrae]